MMLQVIPIPVPKEEPHILLKKQSNTVRPVGMNELYESTSVKTAGIVGNGSNVNLPGQERP